MANAGALGFPKRRVTFRRVSVEQVGNRTAPLVFCPRKLAVLQVEKCRGCDHFAGLCINPSESDAFLRCAYEGAPVAGSEGATSSAPVANAGTTLISEIMTSPVRSATLGMSLQELAALFLSEHIGAVPVVDAHGKPIGIVTKTDAMERYYDHVDAVTLAQEALALDRGAAYASALEQSAAAAFESEIEVREVMTQVVFSMGPSASISRVSALMAYEQVHYVLIVGEGGVVIGIVSSLDVARWIAHCDGYVLPKGARFEA